MGGGVMVWENGVGALKCIASTYDTEESWKLA